MSKPLVVVRGAGDLATGVIQALKLSGYPLLALEAPQPTAIRRRVALCSVLFERDTATGFAVENLLARQVRDAGEALPLLDRQENGRFVVPVLTDPGMECLPLLQPGILVDAILAKRNLGLRMDLAPLVIALGNSVAVAAMAYGATRRTR